MEAIKFSELPSGDKQALGDNDGMPIIASGENRLLSWGQLKKQLKEQTHTNEVNTTETEVDKVPTNGAVERRISEAADELTPQITEAKNTAETAKATADGATTAANEAKTEANKANNDAADALIKANSAKATAEGAVETANTAKTTADTAKATAESALASAETAGNTANTASQTALTAKETAEGAKADANRYYSELSGKCDTNAGAVAKLRSDLEAETTARGEAIAGVKSEVSSVATRVGDIETKIASGELSGGGSGGTGEGGGSVDLTPVNNRLGALEAKDTAHETRLDALESAKTSQAGKITELETAQSSTATIVAGQADAIAALEQSTNLTDSEGNKISVVSALNENKTAAATAQTTADTAKATAETAQGTANTANSVATAAQNTANTAQTTADEAKAKALIGTNATLAQLLACNFTLDGQTDMEASSDVESERLYYTPYFPNDEGERAIAKVVEIYNGNFNRICQALNKVSAESGSKNITISEGLKAVYVEKDEYDQPTGSISWSMISGTRPEEMTIDTAIQILFKNQLEMFSLLQHFATRTKDRDQDIFAIVNEITTAVNKVME